MNAQPITKPAITDIVLTLSLEEARALRYLHGSVTDDMLKSLSSSSTHTGDDFANVSLAVWEALRVALGE